MDKIKKILSSEGARYIIFGALTTFVNVLTYFALNKVGIQYIISNIFAFILSTIFAFITNKIYVFASKTWEIKNVIRECITFLASRLVSFLLDTSLLIFLVENISMNDFIAKCIVNIVVIIVNYIFSKFFVFKKN